MGYVGTRLSSNLQIKNSRKRELPSRVRPSLSQSTQSVGGTLVEWLVLADCTLEFCPGSDTLAVWHVRCYAFAASQGSGPQACNDGVDCSVIAVVLGL